MKVCIAEKPSVAKEIASVLGANQRKDGFYEGNGYQVTWTFGHFCTLKEPNDYAPVLKRWSLPTLPIIPPKFGIKLIENDGVKKQFGVIQDLVEQAEEVINCGDAGQEGELIQRWVLQKAKCQAPIKRLWISSLTEEAIREGFNDLRPNSDFDRLYWAGSSRAIGDWLLGINATRLYTLKFGGRGTVLSVGRVQTPTLAMIVGRYREIKNFVSKPYWELRTKYREVVFNATEGKNFDKEKAEAQLNSISEEEFEITSFEKKDGKESAPKLFDLTSLQVEANKKFGFTADQTLKLAQKLYEKKFLTYPRVDTRYLSEDLYPKIPGILKSLADYQALAAPLLDKPIRKSKNVFNNKKVTDHHAIIPTNVRAQGLTMDERNIYHTVVLRFLANFYPDCKVARTTVLGKALEIEFKATGRQILEDGWRVVYDKEQVVDESEKKAKQDQADSQLLPEFVKGEKGPHEPYLDERQTTPPKQYTEATLLRAMETAGKQVEDEELRDLMKENGIGRPSTRASIIETLFRRKYISRERKNILPTSAGEQLIDTIQNDLLKSAELTGTWENRLRQVESGTYEVQQFLEEMKALVSEVVQQVKSAAITTRIEVADESKPAEKAKSKAKSSDDMTCPKCKKGQVLKGKQAYGCSEYKNGCRFLLPFQHYGKTLTSSQVKALVQKGKTGAIKGFEVDGKKQDGVLLLNDQFEVNFQLQAKEPITCPKCKQGEILKGSSAYGCSRFREGCNFRLPFTHHGKKLSDSQMQAILKKGKSPLIKGFEFEGKKKDAHILLDDGGNVQLEIKEAEALTCPKCKEGRILKGSSAYGCNRFKLGCHFRVPFEFQGKKLTEKQIETLIKKGKTGKIKGFALASGEKSDGKVVLSENQEVVLEEM